MFRSLALLLSVSLFMTCAGYRAHNPPPMSRSPRLPAQLQSERVVDLTPQGGTAEGAVAISPVDARLVIAAGIRRVSTSSQFVDVFRSSDGGRTWTSGQPLPLIASGRALVGHFDPVLAFDRSGTTYIAVMGMVSEFLWTVVVYRSTDGGATWIGTDVSATTSGLADKPWIAVDRSGTTTDGALHAVWYAGGLRVATSRDGGLTWTPSQRFSSFGAPFVTAGSRGEVYVSHLTSGTDLVVLRSDDGGATYGAPTKFAVDTAKRGGTLGVTAFPQMMADVSPRATRGNVYAVYLASNGSTNSVMFIRSTDQGRTWSAPIQLSDPEHPDRDVAFPALDVDPGTGEVVVAWLDRRDDPSNALARLYAARSTDGGLTFDTRAFSDPFDPSRGNYFLGDYNQVATRGGTRVAVFSDGSGHLHACRLDYGDEPPPAATKRRVTRH